ncbi:MAG: hypothetical protein LBV32_08560 [Tannerellaceae bacterium]|jgi:zinc transporter ZupT|nr:hypothetical protein [Tannerellaceae bacterium]
MKRKKRYTTVILVLIAIVAVASAGLYFAYSASKPWLAFFLACCGGVLILNLLFSLLLVRKNFKQ